MSSSPLEPPSESARRGAIESDRTIGPYPTPKEGPCPTCGAITVRSDRVRRKVQ